MQTRVVRITVASILAVSNRLRGERGAWVDPGRLRYWGDDDTREIVAPAPFAKQVRLLARMLEAGARVTDPKHRATRAGD